MISGLACVVIDCADPPALARWWQGLIGGDIAFDDDGDATLHLPCTPRLDFIRVPEQKAGKNRLHLDLATTEYDVDVSRALDHGARTARDIYDGDVFTVLRDPEGNEFCLLRPGWDQHRPPPG